MDNLHSVSLRGGGVDLSIESKSKRSRIWPIEMCFQSKSQSTNLQIEISIEIAEHGSPNRNLNRNRRGPARRAFSIQILNRNRKGRFCMRVVACLQRAKLLERGFVKRLFPLYYLGYSLYLGVGSLSLAIHITPLTVA